MDYNWNWSIFWEHAPGESSSYLHWLITGTSWTLATTLAAFILAFLIGGLVGTLRTTTLRPVVANVQLVPVISQCRNDEDSPGACSQKILQFQL